MERIHIPCPFCNFKRILDANQNTRTAAGEEKKMPFNWEPDFYVKCPNCRKQIALKKVL